MNHHEVKWKTTTFVIRSNFQRLKFCSPNRSSVNRTSVGVQESTREHTDENMHLFISPRENWTKIGWCLIDCAPPWFLFKDVTFISMKLVSLGESKHWLHILISQRRFQKHCSTSSLWYHFTLLKAGSVKCFPLHNSHIHTVLMNTSQILCILSTSGDWQVTEQSGGGEQRLEETSILTYWKQIKTHVFISSYRCSSASLSGQVFHSWKGHQPSAD